jgi:two-component system, cell cycle sensor histidine kinase and response regulator CckA
MVNAGDAVYLLILLEVLLGGFLAALFWAFYFGLRRHRYYLWWAWAWTALGARLALGLLAHSGSPGPMVAAIEFTGLVLGYLAVACLTLGANAVRRLDGVLVRRWGVTITLALVLAGLNWLFAQSLVGWPKPVGELATSALARRVPLDALLGTAIVFCGFELVRLWRRARSRAAGISGILWGSWGVVQLGSASVGLSTLLERFGLPAFAPFDYRLDLSIQMSVVRAVFQLAIALAMLALLLESQRRAEAELHASREALAESAQHFRRLIENSADVFTVVDGAGRVSYASPSVEQVLGHRETDLLGKVIFDFIHPDDAPATMRAFARGIAEASYSPSVQFRFRDGAGGWRSIEASGRNLMGDPQTAGVVITARDITERQRREEALRESEVRFRTLSEAALEGIAVTDEGRIVDGNSRLGAMLGYERQELLGRSVMDFVAPEHREVVRAHFRSGSPAFYQHLAMRRDGSVFPVEVQARTLPFDGRPMRVTAIRDVSERLAADAALRRSEEQYRTLVDGLRDVIFALGADGTVTALNPAFEEITGWRREEWLGKPFAMILHPDDVAVAGTSLHALLADVPRPTLRLRIRTREGGYRIGEIRTSVQRRDGVLAGVLGVARDITDLVALEEQYRQAQKMEAVGRLAGGVAHDFNNLLTVMTSYTHLALLGLPPGDPRRHLIEEIREAAERAATLTRQLLAFSRRQVLQPKVLDLNRVVAGAEALLRRLIGEDVSLVLELEPGLGPVKADASQLEQILMNLAVNARDAMSQGGTLTFATSSVVVATAAEAAERGVPAPGRWAQLRVTDTGTGMDAESRRHAFEPFFTTKEPGQGTGLGLATVYGIVQQSGGVIALESEPGRGTTFRIHLPQVDEPVAAVEAPRPGRPAARPNTETVLLVEDEPAVRTVALEALRARGYTVLDAADAASATKVAEQHAGPIALLVTDVVMPGISGRALADRLVALRPQLRVLFISGYAGDELHLRGVLEDGLNFLQKPFTPDELAGKVRAVLDRRPGP